MFDIYKLIFYLLFTSHGTKWRQEKKKISKLAWRHLRMRLYLFASSLKSALQPSSRHLKGRVRMWTFIWKNIKLLLGIKKKIIVFLLITIYIDHMIQSILNGLNVWMFSPVMGVFSIFSPCQSCVLELTIKKTYCNYDTGHLKKKMFS